MPRAPKPVVAKKPIAVWKKPVKLERVKFTAALSKGIYDAAMGGWKDLGGDVADALEATGLGTGPGELAWKLVLRALVDAVFDLIVETKPFPDDAVPPDQAPFTAGLEKALGAGELTLDGSFFDRPGELPVLREIAAPLAEWLVAHGAKAPEARSIVRRLPAYFTSALHEEWRDRAQEYGPLLQALDTPFARADERERAWERYAARLMRQINEPMLGEAFGIAHVYVPLCAYYEEEKEPAETRRPGMREDREKIARNVVDLRETLDAWVADPGKDEPALRVLAGGPGSGKSSFAKMFAADQAARGRRVLYVPLHLIDPEKDLEGAVGQFVRQQDILPVNPLDQTNGEPRMLLLLDGLDELAMQGKAAAEVAQKFVEEARRLVENRNHGELRLQVLLGGREIVVQNSRSELRKPRQVFYLLPYYVPDEEAETYHDPKKLLAPDRRDAWWRGYGAAKGKLHQTMPDDLRREDLDEITAQPLLGYLVALSYDRGKIDFSKKDELNRNNIYKDLIEAVYERTYAGKQHPSVRGMTFDDFMQLLEDVGASTWHGDGRTTTVDSIHEWCARSGIDRVLNMFQAGAESGATRLLTAFYFRQGERRSDGQKTFEFTHKSFGEYLTARRVVRAIETMHEEIKIREERHSRGWNERAALKHWAEICGPRAMDSYIVTFVHGELRQRDKEYALEWQSMLAHLIGFMLANGMPMEDLSPRPTYGEEWRQSWNAEEALLGCLCACAARTQALSKVTWPTETTFGAWIRRLQGQRTSGDNGLALHSLRWLDLHEQRFDFLDCYGARLADANLAGATLFGTCLVDASMQYANLQGASLQAANLQGANLHGANLHGANLYGTFLERANLEGANLEGANLRDAHLEGANLEGAHLRGANLQGAYLQGAYLQGAYLEGANLQGTNLDPAKQKPAPSAST